MLGVMIESLFPFKYVLVLGGTAPCFKFSSWLPHAFFISCSIREYLNEFAGPGIDHGGYADMAFNNVMTICNLDLTSSSCFAEFNGNAISADGASFDSISITLVSVLGALTLLSQ